MRPVPRWQFADLEQIPLVGVVIHLAGVCLLMARFVDSPHRTKSAAIEV